jgi:transcriptional regulator with XRE-family HTH domain
MSEPNSSKQQPYQTLGLRLRTMRHKYKESAAEVSGAVEIDVDMLKRFEQGAELPSEDILMLLISHFDLADDEAVSLWEMAGYDQHKMFCDHDHHDHEPSREEPRMLKQPVVLLALEARVVYSNGAEVVTDKNGVVLNFTQFVDAAQGAVPVARVGMSYEQAEDVLATLQRALLHGRYTRGPKALPAPRPATKKIKKQQPKKGE